MTITERDAMREARVKVFHKYSQMESVRLAGEHRARVSFSGQLEREDRQHMPRIILGCVPTGKRKSRSAHKTFTSGGKRPPTHRDHRVTAREAKLAHARIIGDRKYGVKVIKASAKALA